MALMSTAEGAAMITESIFENRVMHVPELTRMGANLNVHGATAMVSGRPRQTGAQVTAPDLRHSVCLGPAGLVHRGHTARHHGSPLPARTVTLTLKSGNP